MIDSDGSIKFQNIELEQRPLLVITIAQRSDRDAVLYAIKDFLGGVVYKEEINGRSYTTYKLAGKKAKIFLSRASKYLVIKRTHALWCLEVSSLPVKNIDEFKKNIKLARATKSLPLPNYPTRKWLSGYFDGDGYIGVNSVRKNGTCIVQVEITCHEGDTAGIEIIEKNFGGKITSYKDKPVKRWYMTFDPLNNTNFIDYFKEHSIIKKSQLEAVKEYLKTRDGNTLKEQLKQLKGLALTKSINTEMVK